MATSENCCFTEDEDDQKVSSLKRVITLSSDDDDDDDNKEMNKTNKRHRSLSLTKAEPLKLLNKQPVIRSTRQTSLSIIRTKSDDNSNEERKWNLKMVSSSEQQKKKITKTVNKTFDSFNRNIFILLEIYDNIEFTSPNCFFTFDYQK
jgi:hypothetical protein